MKKINELLLMSLSIMALTGCNTKSIVKEYTTEEESEKMLVGFSDEWFEEQDFVQEYVTDDGETITYISFANEYLGEYGYVLKPYTESYGYGYGTSLGKLTSGSTQKIGNPISEDTDGIFMIDAELNVPSYDTFDGISIYPVYWDRETGMFSAGDRQGVYSGSQTVSVSYKDDNCFHETIINITIVFQYEFTDRITVSEYNDSDELISKTEIEDVYEYEASQKCSYVVVDKELTCYNRNGDMSTPRLQEIEEYKSFESDRINRKDASEKKTIDYWVRNDDAMKKKSLHLSFSEE